MARDLVRSTRRRLFSAEDPQGGRYGGRNQQSPDQPVPAIGYDVAGGLTPRRLRHRPKPEPGSGWSFALRWR